MADDFVSSGDPTDDAVALHLLMQLAVEGHERFGHNMKQRLFGLLRMVVDGDISAQQGVRIAERHGYATALAKDDAADEEAYEEDEDETPVVWKKGRKPGVKGKPHKGK